MFRVKLIYVYIMLRVDELSIYSRQQTVILLVVSVELHTTCFFILAYGFKYTAKRYTSAALTD